MRKNECRLIPGPIVYWGDIVGNISDQKDLSGELSSFATESWVSAQGYLTSETLPSDLATESWVESQGFLTSVPSEYATQSWVQSQGYLTSETIPSDIATQSWVLSQGYASAEDLSAYATESWVSAQGYLTAVPSEYATQSWVQSQGYTSAEDLSAYASESWVEYFVDNNDQNPCVRADAFDYFLSNGLQDYSFATESWVQSQGYLSSGDPIISPLLSTTVLLGSMTTTWLTCPFQYQGYTTPYYFSSNFYLYQSNTLYRYDSNLVTFNQIGTNTVDWNYAPLWQAPDGHVYTGVWCECDLSTGNFWNTDVFEYMGLYQFSGNRCNVFSIGSGTYVVNQIYENPDLGISGGCAAKMEFNEDFGRYTFKEVDPDTGDFSYFLSVSAEQPKEFFFNWTTYYEGHCVYADNFSGVRKMVELVEVKDGNNEVVGISAVTLSEPYFPVTLNGTNVGCERVVSYIDDNSSTHYLFLSNSGVYILNNGAWESFSSFSITQSFNQTVFGANNGRLYLGYGYSSPEYELLAWNFGEEKSNYTWLNDIYQTLGVATNITNQILS